MSLETRTQYLDTLKWIDQFSQDIEEMLKQGPPPDVHPRIWQASIEAMKVKRNDLIAEKEDYEKRVEVKSHECLTDVKCLLTGKGQETEGFKGTPHEGVDVCEDGCVWYKPVNK